ncbi:MAG: hypothetical protein U0531_13785 [Dehalococcoidia bacterium]
MATIDDDIGGGWELRGFQSGCIKQRLRPGRDAASGLILWVMLTSCSMIPTRAVTPELCLDNPEIFFHSFSNHMPADGRNNRVSEL